MCEKLTAVPHLLECKPLITMVKLKETVRQLASEKPDYTYPSGKCFYGTNDLGQPACIFGQAFVRLGYRIEPSWENQTINQILTGEAGNRPRFIENEFANRDLVWCSDVQSKQDCGYPWKEAVRVADMGYRTT